MFICFIRVLVLLLLIVPSAVHGAAMPRFTEIMYDPEGPDAEREWLEIYNDGQESIPFSSFTFYEADTRHGLVPYLGGDALPAGRYAIIARNPQAFLAEYPSFDGIVVKASFSLHNEGESLALWGEDDEVLAETAYTSAGGQGNGKSLHQALGVWTEGLPTPGSVYAGAGEDPIPAAIPVEVPEEEESPFRISLSGSRTALVRVPHAFEISTPASYFPPRCSISYGDGLVEDLSGKAAVHAYRHPGEYVVYAECYRDHSATRPEGRARMTVSVLEPGLRLRGEGGLAVENAGSSEVSLGGFLVFSDAGLYAVARNTFLLPKQRIVLPGIGPVSKAVLLYPDKSIASFFSSEATGGE